MKIILLASVVMALASCRTRVSLTMTPEEARLINESPEVMRILTVDNEEDLAILQKGCREFNVMDINTPEYETLARKMVATLGSTDGAVGLAAPQIGINRRVVAIRRFDKEEAPIEVYADLYIIETRDERQEGSERCLSVPDTKCDVLRYPEITISYTDIHSDRMDQPRTLWEDVSGDMAVIFQHMADHLDGVVASRPSW